MILSVYDSGEHMLDQILAAAVVLLPTLFAVGIELVSKEVKERPFWRVAVLVFGVGLSLLTWFQMSLAAEKAATDQENAIQKTAAEVSNQVAPRVAAETSSKVTESLNRDYGTLISSLYKEIGSLGGTQRQSEKDLALGNMASADIIYAGDRLQIWNRGRTNLYLWGLKYDDTPVDFEPRSYLIAPTDNYYLLTDKLTPFILLHLGQNGEARVPLDLYLKGADGTKYIMHNILWEIVKDGQITIHTQTQGFEREDWSKPLH
jgi:hypothetical protein